MRQHVCKCCPEFDTCLPVPGSCSRELPVQNLAYTNRAYVGSRDALAQMKAPFVQFNDWCVHPPLSCATCLCSSHLCSSAIPIGASAGRWHAPFVSTPITCACHAPTAIVEAPPFMLMRSSVSPLLQHRLVGRVSSNGAGGSGTIQPTSPGNLKQPPEVVINAPSALILFAVRFELLN